MDPKQKMERKKERRGLNDGNNNGQLRIATPPRVAHAKPTGPILLIDMRAEIVVDYSLSPGYRLKTGDLLY